MPHVMAGTQAGPCVLRRKGVKWGQSWAVPPSPGIAAAVSQRCLKPVGATGPPCRTCAELVGLLSGKRCLELESLHWR